MEEQILRYYLKVFSIILFFFLSLLLFYSYHIINKKYYISEKIININKGDNIENVIDIYFNKISIIDKKIFKTYYLYSNIVEYKFIHYGNFYISSDGSFKNFLNIVTKPSNILNKITIVEGWSKKDLDKELSKHFKKFNTINFNDILADTYYFKKDQNFDKFYNKLVLFKKNYLSKFKNNSLSKEYKDSEIIIVGSLIEKEGVDYLDKKKISSVIFNRLKKNMKLQIDATVLFAITGGAYNLARKLTYSDLKIDNIYNTYKINGLPPAPISYVGTKTIDIIFENYKSEYLFYFYNNLSKKHIFSKNFDEHRKKLNEYRNKK